MTFVGAPSSRPGVLVDQNARGLFDPSTQTIVGRPKPNWGERLLWCLPMDQSGMQRYLPNHPTGETCYFGMDFSMVVPPGVGLTSGALSIFRNIALAPPGDSDFIVGPVEVRGRALYAQLSAGIAGYDYQLRWTANDTAGNVWPRTGLILVGQTS